MLHHGTTISTDSPGQLFVSYVLIKLIQQYRMSGYRLSENEIHSLAYLVQEVGLYLDLSFEKGPVTPFSSGLDGAMQRIEGRFILGYGDCSKDAQVCLTPDAVAQADVVLIKNEEVRQYLAQVSALIEGFETPYGIELLVSVYWVVKQETADDFQQVVAKVQGWNARKAKLMRIKHIQKAFNRLQERQWL